MKDLLIEKIKEDIEMYEFVHGNTGSVKLDIRDIRKLIEKYEECRRNFLDEMDKNRELKELLESEDKYD